MTAMKELTKALEELQNEADATGLKIINIETTSKVVVSVDDNPLTPQAVFAVMNCFITGGAKSAEWVGTEDGIDLVATF